MGKYHQSIRESQQHLEDEQRTKEVVRDSLLGAERRANSAQNALEEARTLLEQAKRKLESEMQTLHGDLDEMANEASLSEDKAKKAMVDAARLAEELRGEQDLAAGFEKDRKLLECQVKDMQQ